MMFKMSDANCWYIMRTWLPTLYKENIYFLTECDEISEMIISVSWIAFSLGIKINYHIWSIICHIFEGHHPLNIGEKHNLIVHQPKNVHPHYRKYKLCNYIECNINIDYHIFQSKMILKISLFHYVTMVIVHLL